MKAFIDIAKSELNKTIEANSAKSQQEIEKVTIRFSGDSGDGMQLTGGRFTTTTAIIGNDLATLPDYPAEIRAPAGTVAGVSGFQIHFSSSEVHTSGDRPDVLVAMNPAALMANLKDVLPGGVIIANTDAYTKSNLTKVGYAENPLDNNSLNEYKVVKVPISTLTREALKETSLSDKEKERSKNMFALGITFWMFDRTLEPTEKWIKGKFAGKDALINANIKTLKAGFHFGETTELLPINFLVKKAPAAKGTYRNITGNEAISLGLVAAAQLAKSPMLLATYPITPASDILHNLAKYKNYRIRTFQAEDEIAACCAAIGASYAGTIGVTSTSGPGVALKSEAINLALITELPLVIIDVQRGGPSTGLPTKTEQSDLLQAAFGRNGESPVGIIAAKSAADCFNKAIEAVRLAVEFRAPVFLMTDGYIANGSEPWLLPNVSDLKDINFDLTTKKNNEDEDYHPYERDPQTLARKMAVPGVAGLEHRIGGLEKQDVTGHISYDPVNHEHMSKLRAEKIQKMQKYIPEIEVERNTSASGKSKNLVLGWGSTYGAITDARITLAEQGIEVDQIHIEYINPFPANFEKLLNEYDNIFVAEMNLGQLAFLIQGTFAVKVNKVTKIQGQPFKISEIVEQIKAQL